MIGAERRPRATWLTPGRTYPAAMGNVIGLDHIVLLTTDVERSLAWWTGPLGLTGDRVDEWRAGSVPFPSVRIDAGTIVDLFAGERSGRNLDHVSVVLDPPTDLEALLAAATFAL